MVDRLCQIVSQQIRSVAKASEAQAKLEVGQDSVQLVFSVSFQLQLPS